MARSRVPVYGPPKKVTATRLNIFALRALAQGRHVFPNQIPAVDVPHIRRCLAAGLVEVSPDRKMLVLTPAGVEALAISDNPPWAVEAISAVYETLEAKVPPPWLPKLERVSSRRETMTAQMHEYGCGVFGCVFETLDPKVVLKLTSDPSEVEFAVHLAPTLIEPVVTNYYLAIQLSSQYNGRRLSLLWRESARQVGQVEQVLGEAVEDAIGRQHDIAKQIYIALFHGRLEEALDRFDDWKRSLDNIAELSPELSWLVAGMARIHDQQQIFLSDVHSGNLGIVSREGRDVWVITDPGNVVVMGEHTEIAPGAGAPTDVDPRGPTVVL